LDLGAVPFEIVAGSPSQAFGPRLTLTIREKNDQFLEALGLKQHAWGCPDWLGLRSTPERGVETKLYHRATAERMTAPVALPARLAVSASPVMAALWDGAHEVYWRIQDDLSWPQFAGLALAPLGCSSVEAAPRPRPVAGAFCVSYEFRQGVLATVTLYASDRALPAENDLPALWASELPADDARQYQMALDAARSLGPRPLRGFHAMLGWKFTRDGLAGRAVSLRIPR
jgi:hypothetical protein